MKATLARTGLGIAAIALVLAGCSDIEKALNKGGDTPCSEYIKQDADTKRVTITKAVKEYNNTENEPAGTVVDMGILKADLLCGAQLNPDTPIKNADFAGAIIPK